MSVVRKMARVSNSALLWGHKFVVLPGGRGQSLCSSGEVATGYCQGLRFASQASFKSLKAGFGRKSFDEEVWGNACLRPLRVTVAGERDFCRVRAAAYITQVTLAADQGSTAEFRKPDVVNWDKSLANSVSFIGHVGRDIDIRYLDTGKVVAKTSLAVDKMQRKDREEEPNWYELEFWDSLAEIAAHHVKKGSYVHVKGRQSVDTWTGADHVKRTTVKVSVAELNFVAKGQGTGFVSVPMREFESGVQRPASQLGPDASAGRPQSIPRSSNLADEASLSIARLWQEYFTDPSQWWDNRNKKLNPKAPDFKHKSTKEALWIDSWRNPEWVKDMLVKKGLVANGGEDVEKENEVIGDYVKPPVSSNPKSEAPGWGDF